MDLDRKSSNKTAYLTFDDGPSENTAKILQILDFYQVKATFFVIGEVAQKHCLLYRMIVERGHRIGLHTFTHDYSSIYSSLENFKSDLDRLEGTLKKYIGFVPSIYRFPGGSSNTVSIRYGGSTIMEKLKEEIKRRGYKYYDWNVDSGDTRGYLVDFEQIIENVLSHTINKDKAIVLMHDAPVKTTTVQALPELINGLRRQGFDFGTLS